MVDVQTVGHACACYLKESPVLSKSVQQRDTP